MTEVEEKYFHRPAFEPYDQTKYFDFWRLYYTAFSRAQNLLVLTCDENKFLPIYIRIRHKKMTAFYKFLQKKLLRFPTTTFQSFITLIFEIFFRPLPAALSAAITILHGHRCNALICQSEKSQRERSALLQILFSLLNLYALLRSINHLSKKEKSVPSSLMVMLM